MAEDTPAIPKFYNCSHGASNDPCPKCFPGKEKVPDDWYLTYESPGKSGVTDDTNVSEN